MFCLVRSNLPMCTTIHSPDVIDNSWKQLCKIGSKQVLWVLCWFHLARLSGRMCSCEEQLAEAWTTLGKCPANCYPCAHSDVLAICCRSCEKRSMNLRVLEANELCFKLLDWIRVKRIVRGQAQLEVEERGPKACSELSWIKVSLQMVFFIELLFHLWLFCRESVILSFVCCLWILSRPVADMQFLIELPTRPVSDMPTCCNDLDSLCRAQLNFGSTMVIKTKQKTPVMRP